MLLLGTLSPTLTHLTVCDLRGITDAVLHALMQHAHGLTHLALGDHAHPITPAGITRAIASHVARMQQVDVVTRSIRELPRYDKTHVFTQQQVNIHTWCVCVDTQCAHAQACDHLSVTSDC